MAGSPPALGCTGMEQFLSPAEPSTTTDPNLQRVSIGGQQGAMFGIRTTLKPGNPQAVFCADPGTFDRCWSEDATSTEGRSGNLFDTTRAQIVAVLGAGALEILPEEARSTSFYVRMWATAVVKYLNVAGERPADLSSLPLPAAEDITVETAEKDLVTVRYKNRLELKLHPTTGSLDQITFR